MNPLKLFRRSRSQSSLAPGAHMTWASRSITSSLNTTRRFLKRQIWAWPIIAVVLLATIWFGVSRAIESTMKANLQSQLKTLLDVETAMLQQWIATQERNAESMANDATTRRIVAELFDAVKPGGDAAQAEKLRQQLADTLASTMSSHGYIGFALGDRAKVIQASSSHELVGMVTPPEQDSYFVRVADGVTTVTPPFAAIAALRDASGMAQTGLPTMYAAAPVRDENFQVIATLAFRINPDKEFTHILGLGRIGDSGETYAFNKDGLMLSNSRFDNELILDAVLPDQEGSRSMLRLLVRDPGGDMTKGFRPGQRRAGLPKTRMVAAAASGGPGVDVEGYRDYRGVPVVGAWTWLDKYGYGLATEQDVWEAYRPLTILKRTFWALLGLLMLSSVAIFFFTLRMSKLQRQAREATIEAKQLGQYKLEEKLGAGAMGVVYKGSHAMLRRPTAIKLLDADKVSDEATARFEREVQITSLLTHPNTVAIYDYGRTPEGVFYYAMEYLEGINLQAMVDQYGPQSPGRVIHLLRQVCGSLYEAHSMGLVHRDVKPANLMATRRGAESDVIKVLDFGLVKARDEGRPGAAGDDESVAGTPLYMSPEAIQFPSSVDGCSDIYAVGAVGYFLLTGRPVFEAASVLELCEKHVSEQPVPPSTRSGREIPPDLESALLACLEKSRAKRPQTARDLSQRLARCAAAGQWTIDDAETWWSRHERGQAPAGAAPTGTTAAGRAFEATIAQPYNTQ